MFDIGNTAFTFISLAGHPEGAGRLITFSFGASQGRETLTVSTSSNGSYLATKAPVAREINFWFAKETWQTFAERIRLNFDYTATDGLPQTPA